MPQIQESNASIYNLDLPLLQLSPQDYWTIRDAVEGVQIFGSKGSGKTSGSGKTILHAYLISGMGGIVMTVKPTEKDDWLDYTYKAGRTESLLIFNPDQPWRFNFLDYELKRPGRGAGLTENLVNLFYNII